MIFEDLSAHRKKMVERRVDRSVLVVASCILLSVFGRHDAQGQERGVFLPAGPEAAATAARGRAVGPAPLRRRTVRVDVERLAAARSDLRRAGASAAPLTLNLFDDVVLSAVVERTTPIHVAGGYALSGGIAGDDLGSVTLVVNRDIVAGDVSTRGGSWAIHPAGGGLHVIEQADPSAPAWTEEEYPGSAPDALLSGRSAPAVGPSAASASDARSDDPEIADGSVIDVAAFYTARARESAGGRSQVETRIAANFAYANRALEQGEATPRLRAAHVGETDFVVGSFDEWRGWYFSGQGGEKEIRDDVAADLVVLFVDREGGLASRVFAIVGIWISSQFAHEMGHLLGVRHDRHTVCGADKRCGVPDGRLPFAYGYVYRPGRWRTLMSYPDECWEEAGFSCTMLDRFSNARPNA